MKCPSCLRELPDQSKFCGYCGAMIAAPSPPEPPTQPPGLPSFTVQPDVQAEAGGISAGLDAGQPVMQSPAVAPPPPPEPEPTTLPVAPETHTEAHPEALADTQPEAMVDTQPEAHADDAMTEEPPAPPAPVSASLSENDQPAPKKKAGPVVFVVVAVAVLLIVAGLIWALPRIGIGASSETLSTMPLLVSEDGMLVASGKKALELADDTADYSGYSALCYTMDGKRFVYYDEIDGDLATLYIGAAGGRAKKIDTDVVVGQILVRPGAVLYLRQEKNDTVLCLYDGKQVHELSEDAQGGSETWCCSDDGSFVSYATHNKNGETVGVYRYKGKDYKLSKNTTIIYVSPNGKAAYAADNGDVYDGIIDTLYALVDYEKIEAVAVGEDVVSVLIDRSNNAVAFLGDYDLPDDAGDLLYAKWGKKAVEIDSKVSDLRYLPSGEMSGSMFGSNMVSVTKLYSGAIRSVSESFRGELYYVRKDTLMVSPFKPHRSVELIDDISKFYGSVAAVRGVLYWQDRKDIVSYKIGSFRDPVEWRADAIENGFMVLRDGTVFSGEDDELFIQPYGSDADAVSILKDSDEYTSVGISPDQKLLYYLDDDELYYIPMRGGKPVRVIKDAEDVCLTTAGVYILADYDAEDGGEVFYVGYGKSNPVSIAKDIMSLVTLSYGR